MSKTAWFLLLVLLVPLLTASDCDADDRSNPLEADEFQDQVGLHNLSADSIHLFAPGENFPCCKVPPGDIRPVLMTLKPGSRYTFRAGRREEIVGSITCEVNRPATAGNSFLVGWRPGLTCGTGDEAGLSGWATN